MLLFQHISMTGTLQVSSHGDVLMLICGHMQVIDAINALAKGKKDNTATAEDGAVIIDCGQVRKGSHKPNLDQM